MKRGPLVAREMKKPLQDATTQPQEWLSSKTDSRKHREGNEANGTLVRYWWTCNALRRFREHFVGHFKH